MSLEVHTFSNARSFLEKAGSFLEAHEALNNLILGIATRMRDHPEWATSQAFFATLETTSGHIITAALMDPPREMILAGEAPDDPEGFDLLSKGLDSLGYQPQGINGPASLSGQFTRSYAQLHDLEFHVSQRERVYELRQVNPVRISPGRLRQAIEKDRDTAIRWRDAFNAEVLPDSPQKGSSEVAARHLRSGNIFFWDNNGPVSMAVRTRPTAHGISVGGVYTPPQFRGQGYATSLVATLSQALLAEGRSFCTLYTDLANPTSNDIYLRIGYVPIADFILYRFVTRFDDNEVVVGGKV